MTKCEFQIKNTDITAIYIENILVGSYLAAGIVIFLNQECIKSPFSIVVVVVVVVNFIKHQNRAITGERVAARAAPSYQYAMVLVIIT